MPFGHFSCILADYVQERTSQKAVRANFGEYSSLLKNSSMAASELRLRTRHTAVAVFWSWFLGVWTLFGVPTGSIATFSTG